MADANDPRVAKELAEAMKAVGEYADDATDAFERQAKVVMQMRDAMEEVAKVMYALCQQDCKALNPEVWKTVTKEVLKTNQAMKNTTKSTKELAKTLEKDLKTALLVTIGTIEGLFKGFKNLLAIGKSFAGMVGSIVGTVYDVGKAILSIPFKIMEGLFSMAGRGGSNELDTALQGVVKKYGDLEGASSRAIVTAAKSMKTINEGGIDMYRVFGNLAERIKYIQEMAQGLGSTFEIFKQEVNDNGVAMAVYQKGLGITHEQMEGLAFTALRMGTPITDVMNDMTKSSQALSKAFGVTAKVISADMAKAMKDLAHFGHLAKDEFAATAAFANKLGVSVDKLTSIMDATKTYDQTAESMSKLNETFNTNIDYSKMMMLAQKGPAAQMQYLREEFRKAGKDLSNLDYFEKNLIKSTGVMSDEMLAAAFATKNANVSYDAMLKVSQKATKETLSQGDALKTLKKEIEKRPMEGQLGEGGIFDRFLQGMEMGMERSPAFMKLLMNIRQIFRDAYWAGFKFGQMIVDVFPGVKDILGGLADIFSPSKFKKMFEDITAVFRDFSVKGGKNVDELFNNLQTKFLDFFDKETPAGKKVLEGFEKFWTVIGGIFGRLSEIVVNKLTDAVNFITDWINNGMKIPSGAADTFLGKLIGPFQGAIDAFAEKLWPALKRLGETLWEQFKKALTETDIGRTIVMGAVGVVLLPAIVGGFTNAITAGLFKGASDAFFKGLATSIASNKAGAAGVSAAAGKAVEAAQAASAAAKGAGDAAGGVTNIGKLIVKLPKPEQVAPLSALGTFQMNFAKIGANLLGLGIVISIGLAAFFAALQMVKGQDPKDVAMAAIVFGSVALMMAPAALLLQSLDKMQGKVDMKTATAAALALGAFMLVGIGAVLAGVWLVSKTKPKTENIMTVGLIAAAMVPLFISASLAAVAAGAAGKLAPNESLLVKGAAIIGLTLLAMVAVVGGITFLASRISKETAEKAVLIADVLSAVSTSMLKISLVLVAAAGIGALIVSSGFTAGGFMAAGMTALILAVGQITDTTLSIIDKASQIKGSGAEFESKIKIFMDVAGMVGDLAVKVKDLIKSLDFGFFESESSKKDKMDKLAGIISQLSTSIVTVIETVRTQASQITSENIRPLQVFGEALKGTGSLLAGVGSAMGPVLDALVKIPRYDEAKYNQAINDFQWIISTIFTRTSALVKDIVNSLKEIDSPEKLSHLGKGLGEMFAGIGSLITAMSPKLGDMSKSVDNSKPEVKKFDKEAFDAWLDGSKQMISHVTDTMQPFIDKIIGSLGNLKSLSTEQLKALPSVSDVIKAMVEMVSAVQRSAASEKISKFDANTGMMTEMIEKNAPNVDKLFDAIIESAPKLLTKLGTLATQASGINMENVKKLASLFEVLGTIMTTVGRATESSNWKEAAQARKNMGQKGDWGPIQEIGSQMGFIWNVLQVLNGDKLPNVMSGGIGVKNIVQMLKNIGDVPVEQLNAAKNIGTLFESISKITREITNASSTVADADEANAKATELGRSLYVAYWSIAKLLTGVDDKGNTPSNLLNVANLKPDSSRPGSLASIAYVISQLDASSGAYSLSGLSNVATSVGKVFETIGKLSSNILTLPSSTDMGAKLSDVESVMKSLPEKIAAIKTSLDSAVANAAGATGSFDASVIAIGSMITAANKFNAQLVKIPTLGLPAHLSVAGEGMGFNGRYVYQIKNEGVSVNINLHLDVHMNADKVEQAIVRREGSVIRDRVNYLLENSTVSTQDGYITLEPMTSANKSVNPHVASGGMRPPSK